MDSEGGRFVSGSTDTSLWAGSQPHQSKPGVVWILRSLENDEGFCRRLATELDSVVVAPEYRLAPEHPFPAGLEDCYTALNWMVNQAEALGVDRGRVGIAGNSAGGGLTAAPSFLTRDRGWPSICFQMSLYPMIDNRNTTESTYAVVDPRAWNRDDNIMAWRMYLGHEGD